MVSTAEWEVFWADSGPVLDARSPSEFAQGHLPGAHNLALLDDAARHAVGLVYKQQGQQAAVLKGLELVGPQMRALVETGIALAGTEQQVRMYCWRGGLRSSTLAWLLHTAGLEVVVLRGGYKRYRQWTQQQWMQTLHLHVVAGLTGTGKTEILHLLQAAGQQVLDLEALASHRGSSFGALGLAPQPSNEMFENRLGLALSMLDSTKPIWVEDESRHIGRCVQPAGFWAQLCLAPAVVLALPDELRIERLVAEYGHYPAGELSAAVQRIQKKLGGLATQQALAAINAGDIHEMVRLCLRYYDKLYTRGLAARAVQHQLQLDKIDDSAAALLLAHAQ